MSTRRKKNKAGFAITEVVVSAVLMLITFAGITGLIAYSIRSNYSMRTQGTLIALSHDLFTSLETSDYALISSGSDSVDGGYNRSWTVSETNSTKTVVLTISFVDPLGKTHNTSYKQVYSDPDVSGYISN